MSEFEGCPPYLIPKSHPCQGPIALMAGRASCHVVPYLTTANGAPSAQYGQATISRQDKYIWKQININIPQTMNLTLLFKSLKDFLIYFLSLLWSPVLHLFDQKYSKNCEISLQIQPFSILI